MDNKITQLVFILDRSGSMAGKEEDTIGGFNSLLAEQKKLKDEAYLTTVLFDDKYEVLHKHLPLPDTAPMTDQQYYTRGCTALLDAIGRTITDMKHYQKSLPRAKRSNKVMFTIITDGWENASCEYTGPKIKEMVTKQQTKGWEFFFIGANIDAFTVAEDMGIRRSRAVNYAPDRQGTRTNYRAMSTNCCNYRTHRKINEKAWKEDIEDYLAQNTAVAPKAKSTTKTPAKDKSK